MITNTYVATSSPTTNNLARDWRVRAATLAAEVAATLRAARARTANHT